MPKLIRITTAPISLNVLLPGQMRFMREHGMEVLMVSSDGPELQDVIDREGCRQVVVPMTRRISPWHDLVCLIQLIRLFKAEKPDIVHSHTPKAGLLGMMAAKLAGVRIRIHTVAGLRYVTTTGLTRKILTWMEQLTAAFAKEVWPNSPSIYNTLIRSGILSNSKARIIGRGSSNGVDISRYNKGALDERMLDQIKAQILYNPACIYLVVVGRIVKDKGIAELIRAFNRSYLKNTSLRLLLVGEYEDEVDPVDADTKRLIDSHPAVQKTGWTNHVEYYLSLASVLVHPSHREGFPNVILQAGAMRCPVLCSSIEGNIDIIENDRTGKTFIVNNEQSLSMAIDWFLNSRPLADRYAQVLHEEIILHYERTAVQKKILDEYHRLLSDRNQHQ